MQTTGEYGRNNYCESKQPVFDVLNLTARGLEVEEVNAVYVVCNGPWRLLLIWKLIRQKGAAVTLATKTVRLAAASDSPTYVEGDA